METLGELLSLVPHTNAGFKKKSTKNTVKAGGAKNVYLPNEAVDFL